MLIYIFMMILLFTIFTLPIIFSAFISAAVAVCFMFLLVYSWVFIGTPIVIYIPLVGYRTIALPFTSLKWVIFMYLVVGFASFITWIVGTTLFNLAYFCATTSPGLYSYTLFLIAIYWLGFSITGLYCVKIFLGTRIGAIMKETTRAATLNEAELAVFEAKFAMFDPEGEKKMKSEDFPSFIKELGIYVPEEEMETLLNTFDPEGTNMLDHNLMVEWFEKYLKEREDDILNDKPEDIPEDPEELAIYNAEKARRVKERMAERKNKKTD